MVADRKETEQRIRAIIAEKLAIDPTTVTLASTLQDLGADSFDMVEIIMQIEEDFNIQIDDEEAEKLHSMDEVVNYVDERRKK